MIENGIYDGDIAVIKKTNNIQNGKIAAVLTVENEVTLKTVKIQNSKICIVYFIGLYLKIAYFNFFIISY